MTLKLSSRNGYGLGSMSSSMRSAGSAGWLESSTCPTLKRHRIHIVSVRLAVNLMVSGYSVSSGGRPSGPVGFSGLSSCVNWMSLIGSVLRLSGGVLKQMRAARRVSCSMVMR